jgi:hypothetical protein
VFQFIKDNKEFIPLVAAAIGLIAAILSRKKVIITIHKTESVPVSGANQEKLDKQLQLQRQLRRALGFLILCLVGLISSLVMLWFFNAEFDKHVASHGKVTPGDLNNMKGQVLLLFLIISWLGVGFWGLGAVFQLLKAILFGVRCSIHR